MLVYNNKCVLIWFACRCRYLGNAMLFISVTVTSFHISYIAKETFGTSSTMKHINVVICWALLTHSLATALNCSSSPFPIRVGDKCVVLVKHMKTDYCKAQVK